MSSPNGGLCFVDCLCCSDFLFSSTDLRNDSADRVFFCYSSTVYKTYGMGQTVPKLGASANVPVPEASFVRKLPLKSFVMVDSISMSTLTWYSETVLS